MRRFYGSVKLNQLKVSSSFGQIAGEVVKHLAGLVDSEVEVVLDLRAKAPGGIPDSVVRTVSVNARTLRFQTIEFEEDERLNRRRIAPKETAHTRAVRDEIVRVLADPDIILRQAGAQRSAEASVDLDGEAERQLAEVSEQQKRLARLFVSGGLPEEVL